MNNERWLQIERTFEQALALPEDERLGFLGRTCKEDDELRQEVESLLESHGKADGWFDHPNMFLQGEMLNRNYVLAPGHVVGRYRIEKEIGRGGMGVVYLAARADELYDKRVALKLIKRGMDSDTVLRQFRNERQILASFDHPNIARLLDADTTDDGLPYFVMEYVDGVPVDQYSDKHTLSVTARLEMFRQICAAVTYAHRHLVIHRDIKPSNIIVTDEGVPKLLDFGIAKILQPGIGGDGTATATGLRLMTPEYASPEQVLGGTVTTVSDVYSLGVVLYELLTGHSPHHFESRSPIEVARVITQSITQRPSVVVLEKTSAQTISSTREGTPDRLRKRLRGDLDNIVLTALRKEPERRYQSVEQFSEDIRRHLEGLTVTARSDTFIYRSAKFIRRNRLAVAAAGLVLLFLVGGIITTMWQARRARAQEQNARIEKARAERRFNEVRQLARAVLFDYHDAIKDLPGATPVRERLVKDALAYLDGLASEAGGDPALQRELATAYERVGDVRGQPYGASLGDLAGALESYEKALVLREQLFASSPNDFQTKRELARSYRNVGNRLLQTDQATRGLENLKKSLALLEEIATERPNEVEVRYDLARTYNDLGLALEDWGDVSGSLAHHRKALSLREEFQAAEPQNPQRRYELSVTYTNLGRALVLSNDVKSGLESNQKALTIAAALVEEDSINTSYRRLLAITYQNDGDYRDILGDKNGALESFRKKVSLDEQAFAQDSANARARSDLGYSYTRIGQLLADTGKYLQALSFKQKALEMWEPLSKNSLQDLNLRYGMIKAHAGIGVVHAKLGDRKSALAECSLTISLLDKIEDDPNNTGLRTMRAETYASLAEVYVALAMAAHTNTERREHWRSARDTFQTSLDIWVDMRNRGIITDMAASTPEEIQRETAKCDAALSRSK
jgi:non-specific serine/threonine protein kinase/serine/threonine-protein kinase